MTNNKKHKTYFLYGICQKFCYCLTVQNIFVHILWLYLVVYWRIYTMYSFLIFEFFVYTPHNSICYRYSLVLQIKNCFFCQKANFYLIISFLSNVIIIFLNIMKVDYHKCIHLYKFGKTQRFNLERQVYTSHNKKKFERAMSSLIFSIN